jgi:small subunit ribosomal protein S6
MRRYETFVIVDPDLSQDQRDQVIQRVEELITQMDGFLVFTDDWGERKLAYDIKKKARGYYVRFDYCGLSPLVNEIERFFRIDDRALKYMTILLDKIADLEKIKEEKAEAASKAELKKAAEEASQEAQAAPVEATAAVAEASQEPETAPIEATAVVAEASQEPEAAPVEGTAAVEEETQKDVAPTSDESDSAADTTPLKNPEEA